MAKQLDKTKVAMGNLIPVENQNRKNGEQASYLAVKLEDRQDKEFWCLFTEREAENLKPCVLDDGAKHKKGHLYHRHGDGTRFRSFVLLQFPGEIEKLVTISDSLIDRGIRRAEKNAEDVPTMSWLKNVLD